ncbi:MAG: pyrimidine 5'-nucleotidase [Rhodocyclaceae bacterium]
MSTASATSPVWLFDLDNTLHNTSAHIFPHINVAMTRYIVEHLDIEPAEAEHLRVSYWHRYGATLLGLMRHHNTDPHHFLHHTHQFANLPAMLVFESELRGMLRRLPGRKVVVSNGPLAYVLAVLEEMGVLLCFDHVFGIEQMGLRPKPQAQAFRKVLGHLRVPASRCILVEDDRANLATAKKLGMRTVWVTRHGRHDSGKPPYVDVKLRSVLELGRRGMWRRPQPFV